MASEVSVHRCRFLKWIPTAVVSLAHDSVHNVLAVGRSSGEIELWCLDQRWHCQTRLFCGGSEGTLRRLRWLPGTKGAPGVKEKPSRLFSAGLDGFIREYDTCTLKEIKALDVCDGGVWDMTIMESTGQLLTACEGGTVQLFDLKDGEFALERMLARQSGMVLCVVCHSGFAATGTSEGVITLTQVSTGQVVSVMNAGNPLGADTKIWTIALQRDKTIISGDSNGYVRLWDGTTGVLLQSFHSHAADILSVVVNKKESMIFASGVDHKVTAFTKQEGKWIVSQSKRMHTHDVNSLALCGKYVVSAGVDTQLASCTIADFSTSKMPTKRSPFPHHPIVSVNATQRVMLAHTSKNKLEMWRFGDPTYWRDDTPPPKLILQMSVKGNGVLSACMSPDGLLLACCSPSGVKAFRLGYEGDQVSVSRVPAPDLKYTPGHCVQATPDNKQLIIAHSHHVSAFCRKTKRVALLQDFELADDMHPACFLAISEDSQWAAVVRSNHSIVAINLVSKQVRFTPAFERSITAVAFRPNHPATLAVALSNNSFFLLDMATLQTLAWPKESLSLLAPLATARGLIVGLSFSLDDDNVVILYSHMFHFIADISELQGRKGGRGGDWRGHKRRHSGGAAGGAAARFVADGTYRPLVFMGFVTPREMVVVEQPWASVVQSFPAPIAHGAFHA